MSGRDMTPHQKNNTILFTGSPKQALIIFFLDGTYGTVNCHSDESLTSKGKFQGDAYQVRNASEILRASWGGGVVEKTLLQSSSLIRFE